VPSLVADDSDATLENDFKLGLINTFMSTPLAFLGTEAGLLVANSSRPLLSQNL
jgi:hypothetical protein